MRIRDDIVSILQCPINKQALRLATEEEICQMNAQIQNGSLHMKNGSPLKTSLTQALVREDKQIAYAIRDEIPILLSDEAICLGDNLLQ